MKLLKTLKTKVAKMRRNRIQKAHDKAEYLLNTTKADRKEDRKARKSLRLATRLNKLSDWKPFDHKWINKWAERNYTIHGEIRRHAMFGPEAVDSVNTGFLAEDMLPE